MEESVKNKVSEKEETVVEEEATMVQENEKTSQENNEGNDSGWKKVAIGGVSGILLGAAGLLMASYAMPDMADNADGNSDGGGSHSDADNVESNDYHLDSVSDDMTFGEAFAAARTELGPGGVFEWHGNLYSTDTVEEWNAAHPQQNTDSADVAGNDVNDDSTTDDQLSADVDSQSEEVADADMDDNEVEILGVSNVELADGSEVTVGGMSIDGEEVIVVDIDNDGEFDSLVADMNGDNVIDADEIMDISDAHIGVDDFSSMAMGDSGSDIMEDYSNDVLV